MEINIAEVERASWDARVKLSTEEASRLLEVSRAIFHQLDSLPQDRLENLKAICYGHRQSNITREDSEETSLSLEKALANAPDADEYCFRVPRIVEE